MNEPIMPIYTLQFLEDCIFGESKFRKGQIMQALAEGVFQAAGKALVYDWDSNNFVPITDRLPTLRMGGASDSRAVADFTRVCEQTGMIEQLRKE